MAKVRILKVKWCNQVSPTSHKVGLGWVEAATKTFESLALDLVPIKSDRIQLHDVTK